LSAAELGLLCLVAFLSPIWAAQFKPLPALAMQSIILVAVLLRLARNWKRRELGLPGGAIGLLMAIFAGLCLLSTVTSVSIHATLRELLNVFTYLLIFLLIVDMKEDRRGISLVLACLVVSSLVVSAVGLREYLLSYRTAGSNWRVFSTFFNPDFFAGFLSLILPIILVWFLSSTSLSISTVTACAGLLAIGSLLLTGSRFGALAGLLGIVVCLALAGVSGCIKRPQKIRLLILLVPAILAAGVMAAPLLHKLSAAHGVSAEMYSLQFRLYAWKGAMHIALAHPIFGTGLGTFELVFLKYAQVGFTKLAHNSYLQISAEAGPLAALSLLLLLCIALWRGIAALLRRQIPNEVGSAKDCSFQWHPDAGLLACGLAGGAVASMARNLVDSDWYVTAIGISFWIVLGALVSLSCPHPISKTEHPISAARGRRLSPASYAVVFMLAGLVLVTALFGLAGAVCQSNGDALMAENDLPGGIESYREAATIDPLDPDTHLTLAKAYSVMGQGLSDKSYEQQAENELEKARDLAHTSGKVYYRLAKALTSEGKIDRAIETLNEGLTYDPHSPQLLNSLADLYELSHRHQDALSTYRKMAQIEDSPYENIRAVPEVVEPLYIFARAALGRDLDSKGDKAGALVQYERALDRLKDYQDSVASNHELLEAENRTDSVLDSRIAAVAAEVTTRVKALKAGGSGHSPRS
jgi:O-antigen ligase